MVFNMLVPSTDFVIISPIIGKGSSKLRWKKLPASPSSLCPYHPSKAPSTEPGESHTSRFKPHTKKHIWCRRKIYQQHFYRKNTGHTPIQCKFLTTESLKTIVTQINEADFMTDSFRIYSYLRHLSSF